MVLHFIVVHLISLERSTKFLVGMSFRTKILQANICAEVNIDAERLEFFDCAYVEIFPINRKFALQLQLVSNNLQGSNLIISLGNFLNSCKASMQVPFFNFLEVLRFAISRRLASFTFVLLVF